MKKTAGPARGAVNVPAAMLWQEPGRFRDYDHLILGRNNNPAAWVEGMDVKRRLWLVGKTGTMVIYGEPLIILDRRDEWLQVAAVEQKTSLHEYGYPGWIPAVQVAENNAYVNALAGLPRIAVTQKTGRLYSDPELTVTAGEVSYMTTLPLLEARKGVVAVRLPGGGTGYLQRKDVKKNREMTFSRQAIVGEAVRFMDLPYLWAGTASYGFDCSGFTMRLYQSQGVVIPRDAEDQAASGLAVARQDLLPGDLVFFADPKGRDRVHHVGMYAGGGMMVHAPNSKSQVRTDVVDSGSYGEEYYGARRYA
jgi:cell wall-associated NlpC family hydrolase